jgi:hypothetical protein
MSSEAASTSMTWVALAALRLKVSDATAVAVRRSVVVPATLVYCVPKDRALFAVPAIAVACFKVTAAVPPAQAPVWITIVTWPAFLREM